MPTLTSTRRPALFAAIACAGVLVAAPAAHPKGFAFRVVKASSTSHDTYADATEHGSGARSSEKPPAGSPGASA